MKLYKLSTKKIGDWFVLAEHPTQAEDKLTSLLEKADYGFKFDRKVDFIELIATEAENINFLTGHFLLT